MNTTTRRFPRTLREVLPSRENAIGIEGPVIIPTRTWRGAVAALLRDLAAWVLR